MSDFLPQQVLEFWFPNDGHWKNLEQHRAFWAKRMQGGMDEVICSQFAELTEAAAKGALDHWSKTPRGRLAQLIALDQFPRSLWRESPAAYAQDIKATLLALEGIDNGHYDQLEIWEQQFCIIAMTHCEGPDHLQRMDRLVGLTENLSKKAPEPLKEFYRQAIEQVRSVHRVIESFGRHPHRNLTLGRPSTPAEEAYIAKGDFPHKREIPGANLS